MEFAVGRPELYRGWQPRHLQRTAVLGAGDVTVNVTRDGELNGTRFYDGLRIGFEDVSAGYRINGLRVGSEDAPLQGGTELLLALGFYPAYEFDMDGQVTLGAGGASGEGLTINSDIRIRNGRAAIIAALR